MSWQNLQSEAIGLAEEGRAEEALPLFGRVLQQRADDPAAWLNRAIALRELDRYEEAQADLSRAFAAGPKGETRLEAHRLAGQVAYVRDQFPVAVFHHRWACRLDPENAVNFSDLGDALLMQGRFAAASRAFERAFSHRRPPLEAECYWRLSVVHLGLGQWRALARVCQGYLALVDWQDELAPYAAVYWALAEPARAAGLLRLCPPGWPRGFLHYLAGQWSPGEMLHLADLDGQVPLTEARTYLGLALLDRDRNESQKMLELAARNAGRDGLYESLLARAWLAGPGPTPPSRPSRLSVWVWGARQNELDKIARESARNPDEFQLAMLARTLVLGARTPDLQPFLGYLRSRLPDLDEASICHAITVLCHDAASREQATDLELGDTPAQVRLGRLLRVPDRVSLTVIEPETCRACRVLVSGVADIAQLHLLLAELWGANLGSASAALRGLAYPSHPGDPVAGVWNLYRWDVLREDGSLPSPQDGDLAEAHWIRNEGEFADIPTFEGERVLLLGPPSAVRTFSPARAFAYLPASVTLEEKLDFAAWMARLTAGARPLQD